MMLFGPKNVVGSLNARKAKKFSGQAKSIMQWAQTVYNNNNKDVVPGLTPNSMSAALPDVALILASHMGLTVI